MNLSKAVVLTAAAALALGGCAGDGVRAGAPAGAPELEAALPALAADLLTKAGASGRTLAVGEFKDAEGRRTELSSFVGERLEMAFVSRSSAAGVKVVSRANLDDIVAEWELSVKGQVDDAALISAGKLLGAQTLCVGKLFERGGRLVVQAKIMDAESGSILAAGEASARAGDDLRAMSGRSVAAAQKDRAAQSADGLKVEMWSEKSEYRIGEKMRVSVRANQDCYLTIIDVGTSGAATVIFPNLQHPANAVKAGETYVIPDPSAGFEFEVSGPAGAELLRAVASKQPVVELQDVLGRRPADAAFAPVKEDLGLVTRDIKVAAKKAPKGQWSDAVLKLDVR